MPVYLFTFHAYRSWMPDHPRGYTRRERGYQRPDVVMAQRYRARARYEPFAFTPDVQHLLAEEILRSCPLIRCRCHAITTERSHVHGLLSWNHERSWQSIRESLKTSLTKRLKHATAQATLSRGGSRKRVLNRGHFDHLMNTYLPDHPGISWYEDQGWTNLPNPR